MTDCSDYIREGKRRGDKGGDGKIWREKRRYFKKPVHQSCSFCRAFPSGEGWRKLHD